VISAIVTTHNEAGELRGTVNSIRRSTPDSDPIEIVVVDDGSDDDSTSGLAADDVRLIRRRRRHGVASSRNLGASRALGDALAFLDGHQRLSRGCLQQCADVARRRNAIVWPDVRGYESSSPLLHGAKFELCRENQWFTAEYHFRSQQAKVSRITSLRAPGYVMPRDIYQQVKWPTPLRGWGASEAAVSLKAFFLGIPILHLCGPLARHKFKRKFHYEVTAEGFAWNQAVVARICFDERTWYEHWLPRVFEKELSPRLIQKLDDPAIRDEQRDFQRMKARPDRDFWLRLVEKPEPSALRRMSLASTSPKSPTRVIKR
jgi:glycosyltransferase involved in cell wall biosynthesis